MSRLRARDAFALLGSLSWPLLAGAQEMPVPPRVQGAILSKAFRFDQSLKNPDQIRILMIYDAKEPPRFFAELQSSFEASGITSVPISVDDLSAEIESADAAYLAPDVDVESLTEAFAKSSVLTVTGLPGLVEQGKVSLGIGTQAERPKILIHLERSRIEGHRFSAELLKLSEVFR